MTGRRKGWNSYTVGESKDRTPSPLVTSSSEFRLKREMTHMRSCFFLLVRTMNLTKRVPSPASSRFSDTWDPVRDRPGRGLSQSTTSGNGWSGWTWKRGRVSQWRRLPVSVYTPVYPTRSRRVRWKTYSKNFIPLYVHGRVSPNLTI